MENTYIKYFAKYKVDMPFNEICEYLSTYKLKDITKQASIKTIGFYSNSKDDVDRIRNLDNIIEVECYSIKK